MPTRRAVLAAPLALSPLGFARAQDWPQRPLTMLVPFVAGGPSDIVARLIAARLAPILGQPVVAENRTGANGAIAAQRWAAPAGRAHAAHRLDRRLRINPALRPNLSYDPVRDFAPLTLAVTTPNVLVVNPASVPATDFAGFVAWLKANPTRGAYSTSGVGSSEHLTMELLKLRTGTEAQHVPYQGGAAAATAVLGGDVPFTIQNLGTVAQQIAGGTLRP
jgi:tripartite-type tricarboxylate transporter receptor subunit TctC